MGGNEEGTVGKRFPGGSEYLTVGDLSIDTAGREVRKGSEDLALTAREFDLHKPGHSNVTPMRRHS